MGAGFDAQMYTLCLSTNADVPTIYRMVTEESRWEAVCSRKLIPLLISGLMATAGLSAPLLMQRASCGSPASYQRTSLCCEGQREVRYCSSQTAEATSWLPREKPSSAKERGPVL